MGGGGGGEGSCLFFSENTVLISLNHVLLNSLSSYSIGGKVWFYIFTGNNKFETIEPKNYLTSNRNYSII